MRFAHSLVRNLFVTACVAALCAAPVTAQSVAAPASPARDSLATTYAFTAILHELTGFLARRAFDADSTPWTMSFPDDASGIQWTRIEHELTALLRARPERESDTRRAHLRVSTALATPDSLIVEFDVGAYRRCPSGAQWQGSHTSFRFAVAWSPRASPGRAARLEDGALGPCAGRAPASLPK